MGWMGWDGRFSESFGRLSVLYVSAQWGPGPVGGLLYMTDKSHDREEQRLGELGDGQRKTAVTVTVVTCGGPQRCRKKKSPSQKKIERRSEKK